MVRFQAPIASRHSCQLRQGLISSIRFWSQNQRKASDKRGFQWHRSLSNLRDTVGCPPQKIYGHFHRGKAGFRSLFFFWGGAFFRQTHGQTPCCKLHMAAPVINPKQK